MFPDRCSIIESGRQCPNPPEFVVSVAHHKDEYMVGTACARHREAVTVKVQRLQDQGSIPAGKVRFTKLKPVGTDCIKGDADDYVRIDGKKQK